MPEREWVDYLANSTAQQGRCNAVETADTGVPEAAGASAAGPVEAARLIADHLLAHAADQWLPATDADTARQKAQRAFAAQFLCPMGALTAFLDGDYSDERMEDAAERFGVSEFAVRNLLINNRLVGEKLLGV